jgi:hypothetical protein
VYSTGNWFYSQTRSPAIYTVGWPPGITVLQSKDGPNEAGLTLVIIWAWSVLFKLMPLPFLLPSQFQIFFYSSTFMIHEDILQLNPKLQKYCHKNCMRNPSILLVKTFQKVTTLAQNLLRKRLILCWCKGPCAEKNVLWILFFCWWNGLKNNPQASWAKINFKSNFLVVKKGSEISVPCAENLACINAVLKSEAMHGCFFCMFSGHVCKFHAN